jgi:hypothetical protein
MCTSQFSNRFVIAAAPHSGTQRNIGLQRVEASDLTLPTRFSVRGKDEIPIDITQTTLGSGFVADGWWMGSAWLELGIIDRRAGRSIDLQVPLVTEARVVFRVSARNFNADMMLTGLEYKIRLKVIWVSVSEVRMQNT